MTWQLPFRIRLMESRDVPDVVTVDRMVFVDPWPESAYIQELYFNPNAHYFVLQLAQPEIIQAWRERQGTRAALIVGFVGMRVEGHKGHVSTLAVHPEWHGYGLGEWLLYTALHQALEDGGSAMTLEVRVTNYVAQSLYTKYGFKPISRIMGYYQDGEDAYLMRVTPLDESYRQRLDGHYTALMMKLRARLSNWGTN